MAKLQEKKVPMHFKTTVRADVPEGRKGRHREIVAIILADLDQLPDGAALKVPLEDLVHGKAKVRAALNRACRKLGRTSATATDEKFLYIWNVMN